MATSQKPAPGSESSAIPPEGPTGSENQPANKEVSSAGILPGNSPQSPEKPPKSESERVREETKSGVTHAPGAGRTGFETSDSTGK